MITFKTNKENNEYFTINAHWILPELIVNEEIKLPEDVSQEVGAILSKIVQFEKMNGATYIHEVAIRKDSVLGKFLVTHCDYGEIINEDSYIYFNQIVNAMNIAIYQDNEIYKEIIPLFKNEDSSSKEELAKKYDERILDYIVANDNLDNFLRHYETTEEESEKEPTEYVVYENGEFSIQTFCQNQKVYKKEDN